MDMQFGIHQTHTHSKLSACTQALHGLFIVMNTAGIYKRLNANRNLGNKILSRMNIFQLY